MPPKKKTKAVRRPAKTTCHIRGCANKSAIWILRHEGAPDSNKWFEVKVCVTHSNGFERAKNQDG